jgi:hypothetical protein
MSLGGHQQMRTLEVQLDDSLLDQAERKARSLQTSVGDIVASYLENWATESDRRDREHKEQMAQAHQELRARFVRRDWQFAVGMPDTRDQRNARR